MLSSDMKYAQDSFELFGEASNKFNSHFKLNSLESNVANFSRIKDWEFSVSYGGEFAKKVNGNLYFLSISKKLERHFFSFRYSPSYQKDFLFNTGTSIYVNDTIPVTLKTKYHYEERFGFGYSYSLLKNLNIGFTLRYFLQEISEDQARTSFSDSVTSISTETLTKNYNFWRGDIGVSYSPKEDLTISFSSINLFTQNVVEDENKAFLLQSKKSASFGLNYQLNDFINTKLIYEINNSFLAGINFGFNMLNGNLSLSAAAFHDKYQNPFIAGVIPALNYSIKYFSLTLSGVKYFSDRKGRQSFNEFSSLGIHNLINNKYSFDKAILSINFALNTTEEKLVKFIDVKVVQDIFPTLTENYLDNPYAIGKVVSLTDKPVTVKPSSIITKLNSETVQSPSVTIAPRDTVEVPFYTIIEEGNLPIAKTDISQAVFLLNTINNDPDDEFRKPVLINDLNSWDGKVVNLRYFVKKDFDFSRNYAKDILKNYKSQFDTLSPALNKFFTAKFLFENLITKMVYVADIRASVDKVQFPSETVKLKGGDCDDLSVAYASLLESVGVEAAFVDYKSEEGASHVNLMFNTELKPEEADYVTANDKKYFLRKNLSGKDMVWIPVETTSVSDFNSAWEIASQKFYDEAINKLGLAKGNIQIVDIY
ncbi:MAG: hypothetical protein NTX22_08975 [Ignavibacteriales bacterium]|nr:hypothetical protein [Ignavibacteriales bacterium]